MNLHKPLSNKENKFKREQYLRLKRAAETLAKWQELRGNLPIARNRMSMTIIISLYLLCRFR